MKYQMKAVEPYRNQPYIILAGMKPDLHKCENVSMKIIKYNDSREMANRENEENSNESSNLYWKKIQKYRRENIEEGAINEKLYKYRNDLNYKASIWSYMKSMYAMLAHESNEKERQPES